MKGGRWGRVKNNVYPEKKCTNRGARNNLHIGARKWKREKATRNNFFFFVQRGARKRKTGSETLLTSPVIIPIKMLQPPFCVIVAISRSIAVPLLFAQEANVLPTLLDCYLFFFYGIHNLSVMRKTSELSLPSENVFRRFRSLGNKIIIIFKKKKKDRAHLAILSKLAKCR